LAEANFPLGTTNQKHYPDLGSDTSSVWNFCVRFSDVISRGKQWWRREMSAVFSGYRRKVFWGSYCWFARGVTAAMLVVSQEQKHFSPLGTKLHFHVNSAKNMTIYRFDHQHGRLITWSQTKNSSFSQNKDVE